jgi:hypothetical protein
MQARAAPSCCCVVRLRGHSVRAGSVNNKDIDPANVQIRPTEEEDLDAVGLIDSMYFGTPRSEHCGEKLGSAARGAGINTSLVAEARTSISHVDCKG